jgi:hypothetical protein
MSGGMIEFILGDLLGTDSFKTPQREALWTYTWHARKFMEENLPFWEMEPADGLVESAGTIRVGLGGGKTFQLGPQVFTKPGEIYAVYLPTATPSGTLDLSDVPGRFQQRWYNPRTGEFAGSTIRIPGGSAVDLGEPPAEIEEDWVVLVGRE